MMYIENGCQDCGLPCKYESCPYYRVKHYVCDFCKEETKLYYYDGYELCGECILKQLDVVDGSYW